MRKQGKEYISSLSKLWTFLLSLEKDGWFFSKTQYMIDKDSILDTKTASSELISEVYQIDKEKYLRYDLTIPWKLFIEAKTNQPTEIKRYELGEVFRKGPRKGNRYRNFTQLDIEICSKRGYQTG